MRKALVMSLAMPAILIGAQAAFAAKPVDLSRQPVSLLRSYVAMPRLAASNHIAADEVKEVKRTVDFNQTTHIRIQQTHAGYPVWGGDAIVHVPVSGRSRPSLMALAATPSANNTTMNGVIYQDLNQDLGGASPAQLEAQKEKAIDKALMLARQSHNSSAPLKQTDAKLMVYVDSENKAHWAFLVSLYRPATEQSMPAAPTYIIDAQSFAVYLQWNNAKSLEAVQGGGFGGNEKTSTNKLFYDGLPGHLAALNMMRDVSSKTCYLQNDEVIVRNGLKKKSAASFPCESVDKEHNNLYWDGSFDHVNGGYSPANDALFAGSVIKAMYINDYKTPMLVDDKGEAMKLDIISHSPNVDNPSDKGWENAVWVGEEKRIYLGDGAHTFYPLTSLGVVAHEVSHGFTQQHSDLQYVNQSGALNESFSDMAAQAAEYHATGKSSWQIGSEIIKQNGAALRYMDQPSKDCEPGSKPGQDCSIDTTDEYNQLVKATSVMSPDDAQSYIVHLASGVYNRLFYLIATSPGWDVKKTFEVMVKANMDYWTSNADFSHAACGVLKATKDFRYDTETVVSKLKEVGISSQSCQL